MSFKTAAGSACVAVILLLVAFLGVASAGATPTASKNATVKNLFQVQCSLCHGQSGAGDTSTGKALNAADLRSADVQKQSDAQLAQVIANGKNNMPPFADSLTTEQIRALVAYIRALGRRNSSHRLDHPASRSANPSSFL